MGGPPLQSLVKYDTPSLLTSKDKSKKGAKGGKKLPPVETKQPLTQTEDILNSILPPRYALVEASQPCQGGVHAGIIIYRRAAEQLSVPLRTRRGSVPLSRTCHGVLAMHVCSLSLALPLSPTLSPIAVQ